MRVLATLAVPALLWLSAAAPARAQGPQNAEGRREAERLSRSATRDYERGRYEQALSGYEQAYARFAAPGLLFNIAQCHRELGQYQLAIERYEQYLREQPDARNRALVLDLVAESRAELARGRARAEQQRSSGSAGLATELERQSDALEELERARRELEEARASGAEDLERQSARYEAALAELETARQELAEARERVARENRPVTQRWWFWTLIGTAVLLVAGGITFGILLSQEPSLPQGTLGTIDLR